MPDLMRLFLLTICGSGVIAVVVIIVGYIWMGKIAYHYSEGER